MNKTAILIFPQLECKAASTALDLDQHVVTAAGKSRAGPLSLPPFTSMEDCHQFITFIVVDAPVLSNGEKNVTSAFYVSH